MPIKPRDYADKEWQKSVSDAVLAKVIVQGSESIGHSAVMPASPDLADDPEAVKGLVAIVRSFAGGQPGQ